MALINLGGFKTKRIDMNMRKRLVGRRKNGQSVKEGSGKYICETVK